MTREFNIFIEEVLTVIWSLDGLLTVEGSVFAVYKVIYLQLNIYKHIFSRN